MLLVHERAIRRPRVLDDDRPGDRIDNERRMARRDRGVGERNVDLLPRVGTAYGFASAVKRPKLPLSIRLIGKEETTQRVGREGDSQ